MSVAHNIQAVQQMIAQACDRAGRNPADVRLIAVSKTHPVDTILEAMAAGLQHFGENRVEEAEIKIPVVNAHAPAAPVWHMVGHIQSRKAKAVLPLFQYVHSVDSLKLAGKLSTLALEQSKKLDVLLEVNVSGEEAKYGFEASGWAENADMRARLWPEIEQALALPGLNVIGLMTMAPIVADAEETRPVFRSLAALRTALCEAFPVSLPELSMGMTDDYPVAIEEGATMVRIGRAIFGERVT